jgi:hypothetical protein
MQGWVASLHAETLQHTPSTQKLRVRQSIDDAHASPWRFLLPQRPVILSQIVGATQSASVAQAPLQALEPVAHLYGAHDVVAGVGALQVPRPSHVLASVRVEPEHEAARHSVPAL